MRKLCSGGGKKPREDATDEGSALPGRTGGRAVDVTVTDQKIKVDYMKCI